MSFHLTILKVLAGHPEGRAPLADLKQYVTVLTSSGADWTQRMKRLAARAPGLNIFSSGYVLRDAAGWQITHAGRAFLASIEAPAAEPVLVEAVLHEAVLVEAVPLEAAPLELKVKGSIAAPVPDHSSNVVSLGRRRQRAAA